jgi:hypothetical protein
MDFQHLAVITLNIGLSENHAPITAMVNDLTTFKHPKMICPDGILANLPHLFVK